MATASVPNTFIAGANNDPTEVNANFTSLVTFVNDSVVHRDGTKAMTAAFDAGSNKIVNVSSGTASSDAVNKGQLDAVAASIAGGVPSGTVTMYAGASAPSDWLLCQGQAVSRVTYATLFAAIGTAFGAGDGSTTFNLPDFRSKLPVGLGTASWSNAMAETGGSADAVTVSHSHTASDSGHNHQSYNYVRNNDLIAGPVGLGPGYSGNVEYDKAYTTSTGYANITVNSAGSSGTNANLPPYLTLNFIIKT